MPSPSLISSVFSMRQATPTAMCVGRNPAVSTLQQVLIRRSPTTAFLLLLPVFRPPIVSAWRAKTTPSTSVPAVSAPVAACARMVGKSVRFGGDRTASPPKCSRRSGGPAAIPTARRGTGRQADDSTRGAEVHRLRWPEGPQRVEPGRERRAHAGAAGHGEGPHREAQPAARSRREVGSSSAPRRWTRICAISSATA